MYLIEESVNDEPIEPLNVGQEITGEDIKGGVSFHKSAETNDTLEKARKNDKPDADENEMHKGKQ